MGQTHPRASTADTRALAADTRAQPADTRALPADTRAMTALSSDIAPIGDTRAPAADTRAPTAVTRAPTADTRAPTADTRAPTADIHNTQVEVSELSTRSPAVCDTPNKSPQNTTSQHTMDTPEPPLTDKVTESREGQSSKLEKTKQRIDGKQTPSIPTGTNAAPVPSVAVATSTQTRIKKLFRRQSSTRVFPDEGRVSGSECQASGPAASDQRHALMFSGTVIPVPLCEVAEAKEGFLTCTQLYNSLNDGQLSPLKYDPTFMLIVDMRSLRDFQKLHIVLARHVSELRDGADMEPLDNYTMLILYDHKGLSHSLPASPLSQTLHALRHERLEPFVLSGGFDAFMEHFPYLCTSKVATCGYERQKLIPCYPSMICPHLYLGRGDQATNPQIADNLGLTHILNVTRDCPNAFPERLSYLRVALDDDSVADLGQQFPQCIDFMRQAIGGEGALLVHCNLGMSRSSTVIIAYLMYSRHWILRDAHRYVKERRPIIHPNNNFMRQLSTFESALYGRKITDVSLIPGYRSYTSSEPSTPVER